MVSVQLNSILEQEILLTAMQEYKCQMLAQGNKPRADKIQDMLDSFFMGYPENERKYYRRIYVWQDGTVEVVSAYYSSDADSVRAAEDAFERCTMLDVMIVDSFKMLSGDKVHCPLAIFSRDEYRNIKSKTLIK